MIIRCATCSRDPIGRWKELPAIVFIDRHQTGDGSQYRCSDHLSERREAKIKAREKDLGWPPGGLR